MGPFVPSVLTRSRPIYQVFGANTGVGKTVVSTTLCSALRDLRPRDEVLYMKPVSTGLPEDADDLHINRYVKGITTSRLHSFDKPLSPHLAAKDFKIPNDSKICKSIVACLEAWVHTRTVGKGVVLIETAGGVLSPSPSGSLQADLYRPLRFPVILAADSCLGGISSTISAYESLTVRGYDIEAIVVFRDDYYCNHEFFERFARPKGILVLTIPTPPPEPVKAGSAGVDEADVEAMKGYYNELSKSPEVAQLLENLDAKHAKRIERLESMAEKAHGVTWYPFTQHHDMTPRDLTVIDSAHDDCFQTLKPAERAATTNGYGSKGESLLQPTFDGSASWWTQGLGHGSPELAMTAAYAAGRYGHVMFAGTTHEPALSLSELLLKSGKNPRLQKVFFTDNGSTGMEVAVKMGLRASSARYGWSADEYKDVGILGLSGSYHGDTMGAMDCSEPSTFNNRVEWYRGRGHWLDFPKVKMVAGKWMVGVPESMRSELGGDAEFPSLSAIFNLNARKDSVLAKRYADYVKNMLEDLVVRQGRKFGALIIEPIVLGAGGMIFSDPLFQHILIQTVRSNPQLFSATTPSPSTPTSWSGLPIIFDEVFAGLYRLGRRTAASFLQIDADISVNSKLLTGGLMPLCTTLASNEIFAAFDSPSKVDALLHGHSYTANPVGCAAADYSVRKMLEMEEKGHWREYVRDWNQGDQETSQQGRSDPEVWSCWSQNLVCDLSFAKRVESVFAIGTVLSITLRDQGGQGGYTSTAAAGLQQYLRAGDGRFNVHSRVLGNVLYLMASLTSKRETLQELEVLLRKHLL